MRRDQLPPHKTATYVLPQYKTVYVSVPKAACTSLKWLVAELQGEDPERFYRSRSREVGRAMTIHRRERWRHTPMLHELPDGELDAISPEAGWFVFAVVRHPYARLWAAWQSKFLLREPRWIDEFGSAPWLPRIPRTTADVVEDFGRFVASLADEPDQPVLGDRHFMTQARLLTPGSTPYTRIYDTSEIPALLDDLAAHLRGQGWEGTLTLGRNNETPLAPIAPLFGPAVTESILAVYGPDFDTFGYRDAVPATVNQDDAYPPALVATVGLVAERAARVGDLALLAQSYVDDIRELRDRNTALVARNKSLKLENRQLRSPGIRSAVRRAYRKLAR